MPQWGIVSTYLPTPWRRGGIEANAGRRPVSAKSCSYAYQPPTHGSGTAFSGRLSGGSWPPRAQKPNAPPVATPQDCEIARGGACMWRVCPGPFPAGTPEVETRRRPRDVTAGRTRCWALGLFGRARLARPQVIRIHQRPPTGSDAQRQSFRPAKGASGSHAALYTRPSAP